MEVTSTVVGVLSLGIQVTQGLIHYYKSARDQKVDITNILNKLNNLATNLQVLHNNLRSRKFKPDERKLLQAIESTIQDCARYIHELHNEAKKFSESSSAKAASFVRTATRRLAYPLCQSTLLKLEEVIDRLSSQLSLGLHVMHLKSLSHTAGVSQGINEAVSSISASQVSEDIRHWLAAPDASVQYNDLGRNRYPNTGNWFFKSRTFSTWLAKPNSFLWLNGFAGCGKSVLSSTAIQHTLSLRQSNPAVGVAYFFFMFNDQSRQSTSSMLRSLILQLLSQLKVDNLALGQLWRLKAACHGATPADPALLSVLRTLVRQFNNAYIILDALDESPRRNCRGYLLDTIQEIREWSDSRLHLLVTSRNDPSVRESLRPVSHETLEIKREFVQSDIEAFIKGTLQSSRRLQGLSMFHTQIREVLTSKAEGSFRWVECHFDALSECPANKTRVNGLLASWPRGLADSYERMLLDIDSGLVEDARRVLTMLCTASRPLTPTELINAVSEKLDAEDFLRICPGLVVIEQSKIRLVHSSVRDFLQSEHITQSRASSFRTSNLPAQRIAVRSW